MVQYNINLRFLQKRLPIFSHNLQKAPIFFLFNKPPLTDGQTKEKVIFSLFFLSFSKPFIYLSISFVFGNFVPEKIQMGHLCS